VGVAYQQLIGRSVRGRPIGAILRRSNDVDRTLLVVGCIHGSEPAGISIAKLLKHAQPPAESAVWIVPDLNPDGFAAGTRQNADRVDLNRNFPWHWQRLGTPGYLQYSGPHPLSEPEARAARRLILQIRPQVTVWFHQPRGLVDLSGGNPDVEHDFAASVGLPVAKLPRYPGSAVSWENSTIPGSTAFVVELPPGPVAPRMRRRYVRALLALAKPATSP
jgi:protein MpaA